MNQLRIYVGNDLRLIFRDPVLYALLFVPLIIIGLLRFGIPPLVSAVPDLEAYTKLMLAVFCMVTALFPAFIISFVILDERDQDVLTAIRILPVSVSFLIVYRMMLMALLSFINCVLTLSLSGVSEWGFFRMILISLAVCLVAPLTCLWITAYARNKIEGATWVKGLNFLFNFPILGYIFEGKWEYIMGLIPSFWIFKMFDPGPHEFPFSASLLAGYALISALLLTGWRSFHKRVLS